MTQTPNAWPRSLAPVLALLLAVTACSSAASPSDQPTAQGPQTSAPLSEPTAPSQEVSEETEQSTSSPLLWYSLREEYEADNRLDEYERLLQQGGIETEGENCGELSCNAHGRLTIDIEAGCVYLDDESTGDARALAWWDETTSWVDVGEGLIVIDDGFEPYASLQDGSLVSVDAIPLDPSSPFLTPRQPDLCASTLWLVTFVAPLDRLPITDNEGEPTPTPG